MGSAFHAFTRARVWTYSELLPTPVLHMIVVTTGSSIASGWMERLKNQLSGRTA